MRQLFFAGKILLLLVLAWLLVLVFVSSPLVGGSDGQQEEILAKRLVESQGEVAALKRERDALARNLRTMGQGEQAEVAIREAATPSQPSSAYEEARRKAARDTRELWNFVRVRLEEMGKENSKLEKKLNGMISELETREQAVLVDLEQLRASDGFDEWREGESKALSALVQARLHYLQNPEDCSSARKLVCNLNKGCGYGCQIHHAIYCFLVAYGTERTLILKSKGWRYNKKGFENVFLPLSETCTEAEGGSRSSWPGKEDTQIVELPIVDSVNPRPPFLPQAVPADLVERISRLHGDPIVWWVSQFLLYMLRPQPHLTDMLQSTVNGFGMERPMVGIHIRRTDKVGTEAAFHPVEEYMKYVEEWFRHYELTHTLKTRRVYVASDDPKVLGECRKKYPNIEFLGDQNVAKSAAVSSRYTDSSLRGVIQDIHMLSISDFLVCTFSSQVCRIAYELMQQHHVDASDRFKSLDDIWYYGGQDEHQQEAVLRHEVEGRSGEISLEVGDVLGVAGNHWNGFNKGRNHRTNRVGLYPEYKTKEKLRVVNFPKYPSVQTP